MEDNRPGPSSRVVRRRTNMGSTQLAEVYARLSKLESSSNTMEQVTGVRFRELQQDVERLDSNNETQKKFMAQELVRIEEHTHSAVDRTQSQIDSLRQQTTDMHTSLSSIHHHSETLTNGLKTMMESFRDLRFDLPNAFDDWIKVREGRGTGTVSGAELQPWNSRRHTPLPSLPNLPPLVVSPPPPSPNAAFQSDAPDSNTASTETAPRSSAPNSATTPDSPNEPYQGFMHLQEQSDAMLDLQTNLDTGDDRQMDVNEEGMGMEGIQTSERSTGMRRMEEESDPTPLELAVGEGSRVSSEVEGNVERVGDLGGDQQAGGGSLEAQQPDVIPKVECRQDSVPAPPSPVVEPGPIPADQDIGEGQEEPALEAGPSASDPISSQSDVGEGQEEPALQGRPSASDPISSQSDVGEGQEEPALEGEPSALDPISSQSLSPSLIREVSVPPPSGLLVSSSLEVIPPSSQPSIPSSSPQPDFRLLNAPPARSTSQAPSSGGNEFTGRITRSRSGSVSKPPHDTSKPPSQSKRKGARNGPSSRR